MSAAPARRLATAGTLALALALGSPVPALADPGEDDDRGSGRSEHAQEHRSDRGAERASESPRSQGSSSQAPSSSQGSSSQGSGDDRGQRQAGSDPRGNNGTVKIDGVAFDDGLDNEPHVGCVFQVDFYGFDAGDTASITFTGQAPTGGGLLHSETATPISDDAAGGGQDRDATLTYSVSDQLAELLSVAPHPQQGWHVKLEVDVDSAPGGAKSKVLWIDCPQPAALAGSTSEPATGEALEETEQTAQTPLTTAGTPVPTFGEAGGVVAQSETAVAGTTLAAAEQRDELALGAAGAESVSTRGSRLPSVLAFTGIAGLVGLLALGLTAVGAGAAAQRLGRRSAAGDLG